MLNQKLKYCFAVLFTLFNIQILYSQEKEKDTTVGYSIDLNKGKKLYGIKVYNYPIILNLILPFKNIKSDDSIFLAIDEPSNEYSNYFSFTRNRVDKRDEYLDKDFDYLFSSNQDTAFYYSHLDNRYSINLEVEPRRIELSNYDFDSVLVNSNKHEPDLLDFSLSRIKNLTCFSKWKKVTMNSVTVNDCSFESGQVDSLNIEGSSIKKFTLSNFIINKYFEYDNLYLPDTLTLNNVSLGDDMKFLDFTKNFFNEKPCEIFADEDIVSKLKIDYSRFHLNFKETESNENRLREYELLLEIQKENHFDDGYKKLDIEYHDFQGETNSSLIFKISNYIKKIWSNYGYDKENIFINSFIILLLFSFITFFILKYLNEEIYAIENIPFIYSFRNISQHAKANDKKSKELMDKKLLHRMWFAFIYTSIIFFRLTIKPEKINFNKIGSIYIILLYTVGIICLAYMANYVLSK